MGRRERRLSFATLSKEREDSTTAPQRVGLLQDSKIGESRSRRDNRRKHDRCWNRTPSGSLAHSPNAPRTDAAYSRIRKRVEDADTEALTNGVQSVQGRKSLEIWRAIGGRSEVKPPHAIMITRRLLDWGGTGRRGPRSYLRRIARQYLAWNRSLLLDPWLRYSAAIRIIRATFKGSEPSILDVGSGNAGAAYFLRSEVVGIDCEFSREELSRLQAPLQPVKASAANLPFRDRSFDVVVSMDLLEHLPTSIRSLAVAEMLRTTRCLIILGFPFGPRTQKFDELALSEERLRGTPPDWREEHVSRGIPGDEIHRDILDRARRRNATEVLWFPHEGLNGLRLRWKLQFLVPRSSRVYGLINYLLYRIHSRGRPRFAYRRVYVIRLAGS